MNPEIEKAVQREISLWRDHKYTDGELIIAWMKPLQKFHIFQYWMPSPDGKGHLIHPPIPSPMGGKLTIIVHDFVPYTDYNSWMLRADTTDDADPTIIERMRDLVRGLFL